MVQQEHDHIIAIDYAERNVAIARLTKHAKNPLVLEGEYSVRDLQQYLDSLKGTKLLVIEETTTAHYLYCNLREYVDRIIICDPHRNRLLGSGPKTDRIDARKLAQLARAGLLKEVFHANDELMQLRQLVSGYEDVIRASVRLQNQKSAVCRQVGVKYSAQPNLPGPAPTFVVAGVDQQLAENDELREKYLTEFARWTRRDPRLQRLCKVPGIGVVSAVKILAMVIDARRFRKSGHYLGYCGLVVQELTSGGRSYGWRRPRCCRLLKGVYKSAAMAVIHGKNDLRDFYEAQLARGREEHNARHAVARQLAVITYGMLKHDTPYQPYRWRDGDRHQRGTS